ncbi:hypothetical protein ACWD5R_34225 [Streptomyces sp. NPDC002514]
MADLRELHSIHDVRSAANGDALLLWAAGDAFGWMQTEASTSRRDRAA